MTQPDVSERTVLGTDIVTDVEMERVLKMRRVKDSIKSSDNNLP